MERFNLTRIDLMLMSWTEVVMLFDATYEEPDEPRGEDAARRATPADYKNWI